MEHENDAIWKVFVICAVIILLCTFCWSGIYFRRAVDSGQTRGAIIVDGPAPASPEPTPTVNFLSQVILIHAEADARSQGVDDTIRHTVVVHNLRRETLYDLAWLGMPWALILIGGAVFVRIFWGGWNDYRD